MTDEITTLQGTSVFLLANDGDVISSIDDFMDPLGNAAYLGATWVIIPTSRLAPEFFELRTKLAGEILQKLVNYNVKCAIVGDISAHVAKSNALRDFVYECNNGPHVRFVETTDQLTSELANG